MQFLSFLSIPALRRQTVIESTYVKSQPGCAQACDFIAKNAA
jgi:hypothetical protein